jgi:DNA-binding LytR/AlgR family response regulator
MSAIRVLLVDDEPPARRKLRRFLLADPDFEVVGEAGTAIDAKAAIDQLRPDLVFLDVQMPGPDGFFVAGGRTPPFLVFITAHEQFAVKAFEVQALDYLLKPVDRERFDQVLVRVKRRLQQEQPAVTSMPRDFPARILIDTGDRSVFLAPEKIARVQAERNYLAIHSSGEVHRVRGTLDAFAAQLDPGRFLRINRSDLVNVDAIAEMRPWFHGESIVLMKDGTELRWTRRFRPGRPGVEPGDPESIA